jgi:hypothetical protein
MAQTVNPVNPVIDVAQQLQEGKVPSTEQATAVLQKADEFLEQKKQDPRVNPESAKVLSDVQELAQATKQLLQNKNSDEKLQKFVEESQLAAQELAQRTQEEAKRSVPSGADPNQMKNQARQVGQATLEVLKMVIRSGEFRMFLLDFTKLIQDLLVNAPPTKFEQPSEQSSNQGQQPISDSAFPGGVGAGVGAQPATAFPTTDLLNFPSSNVNPRADETTPLLSGQTGLVEHPLEVRPYHTGTAFETQSTTKKDVIPEERKRELSWRFISVLRKMNSNPQFAEGMRFFQGMINDFTEEAKQSNLPQEVKHNEHVQRAFAEAKAIIQEFSGKSIDKLLDSIKQFGKSLRDDEPMRQWLDDIQALFSDVFNDPHAIDDFSFVRRSEELFDRGRDLAQDDKWKSQYQGILQDSNELWESIKNDPDVQQLDEKTSQLMEKFTYVDEKGNRQFNTDLVGQLRQYIVPLFIELLDKIPIPAVEGRNEDYDYRFDNLILSGYDIIPDHIEVHTRSEMDISLHKLETNKASSRAAIRISNIRTKMENIQFWFVRKSFPKLEDSGVADLAIQGEGMTITIFLQLHANAGSAPSFVVTKVNTDIDRLNVNIKQAKHDILLNMWTTLFKGTIKDQFSSAIEAKIKQTFGQIEQGLNTLLNKYVPEVKEMAKQTVTGGLLSGPK